MTSKPLFKVCSLNVDGLTDKNKTRNVVNLLKGTQVDIFLQETHLSDFNGCSGEKFSSPGTTRSASAAILFHPDFKFELQCIIFQVRYKW